VIGLDPGIRTGVKVAVVDRTGKLVDTATIYPHQPRNDWEGSLAVLAGMCVLGSLSFCALGLLIASRVRTIEAASGLMNAAMMPMWVLSGVFFSAQRFPDAVQPLIRALPLTAAIDALRANMLQGAGLAQVAPQLGVMGAWLVVCFGLALRLFRWR